MMYDNGIRIKRYLPKPNLKEETYENETFISIGPEHRK